MATRLFTLYHRAETFGGSFNSVIDVLSRIDRGRFDPIVALPGPGNCADQVAALGIPVLFLSEHEGARTPTYAAAVASAAWQLRRRRIDIVYVSDYVTWRSSVLAAARLLQLPSVVHVRSPLAAGPIDPELQRATIIVGNSAATVSAIRPHRDNDSVRVVYNFLDIDRFQQAEDHRRIFFSHAPPVVGFLGVFRPEKGVEYFLQMVRLVAAARPDVRFLAVGGESAVSDIGWFPKMRQYAAELGVDRIVHFTGSRDDVPEMLKSMDVLVVPSLNEGFGRVIIEANAAGVPVVGAAAAGIPEVIEDGQTGLLVPPRDPRGMADAVLRLLENDAWRRQLSNELPAHVRERFSPDVQMRALEQSWVDALRGRANGPRLPSRPGASSPTSSPTTPAAGTTKPINVLYLTDNPNLGASVRVVLDWIRGEESVALRFHVGLTTRGPLLDWLQEHNAPFVLMGMPWFDRRRPLPFGREISRLVRYARQWDIDVVHAEHNVYPFAAPVARLIRRPIVCHVHYLVDRGFAEWALGTWRRPDHLLWTSRAQMAECRECVEHIVPLSRQSVIHLGVDLERFGKDTASRDVVRRDWGVSPDTVVIGAANALRPRKRVGDFLQLVQQLSARHPAVVGVIAGTAPEGDEAYEREMKALHQSMALGDRVRWLGHLEPIEPFMHGIDIFVSTSGHETFGMSLCEAMACSKPVVTYEAGSASEVVGNAGMVVETGDLAALAAAVERLVVDDSFRETMGMQGRARVAAMFDPNDSLRKLGALYQSIIAAYRRGEVEHSGTESR